MLAADLFSFEDVVVYGVIAGVLASVMVWLVLSWSRAQFRFGLAGIATTLGWVAWNETLNVTHAKGFDTDAPVVALSWQDAGSGLLAFVFTALVLVAVGHDERAGDVVGTAIVAGLTAMVFDIFVL